MKINSIYGGMHTAANNVPDGENVKLLLRHSIRHEKPETDSPDGLLLTNEGIEMSKYFGQGLTYKIGCMCSSNYKRCIQTLNGIAEGKGLKSNDIKISEEYLSSVYCYDKEISNKELRERNGIKNNVFPLCNHEIISGFNTIDETTKKILDFIFQNGNQPNTLDIFCTHDINIAILCAAIFGVGNREEFKKDWPMMLEGVFMWGTRDNFNCAYRNKLIRVQDF